MRILLLILFIQCTFSSSAQTTVMIMFNKQSTGDYDIMIRDILNDNGYDAFVNYGNDNLTSDLVIVYEDFAHEGDSSLESYSMALFRADGTKIKETQKSFINWGLGFNAPKQICRGLSNLFPERFDCQLDKGNVVNYFNITLMIHKIDSSTYSLVAQGAGIRPLRDVENAFLRKAGQYLNSFEYYFENSQYGYTAPGSMIPTSHTGFMVYGIIQGTDSSQSTPIKLENKPLIFEEEFSSFSSALKLE